MVADSRCEAVSRQPQRVWLDFRLHLGARAQMSLWARLDRSSDLFGFGVAESYCLKTRFGDTFMQR